MSESQPVKDTATFGMTENSKKVVKELIAAGYFKDQVDIIRLAIAIAIKQGLQPDISVGGRTTTHNLGTLDENHSLRLVVKEVYPDFVDVPGRALEDLAEKGLAIIGQAYEADSDDFALMSLARPTTE